ncbi:MAG: lysoplasmalogenase [Acidobacteriota bacterium]
MMGDVRLWLSLAVVGSAFGHIRAEYRGPRWQVYLFKPLTTALILLVALAPPHAPGLLYRGAILAGLLFSLAGDIFLMLPRDRFVASLVSFLVAHLCYIAAFSSGVAMGLSPWTTLPLVAAAAILLWLLWPHLGSMRIPVLLYVAVILCMAWRALVRWQQVGGAEAFGAATGALLFVASDATLALDRFRGRFRSAQLLILSAYTAAQWLIAASA